MTHIFTYDEIKQEFEDRGYVLLTTHKLKTNEKYEYICPIHKEQGSQFISWAHFHNRGQGCRFCGREKCDTARRKDLSTYNGKELAESKGFEYVGMSRHDSKIWVQFICPKHREYGIQEMPYNNMKRVVVGCQHCIGRNDDEHMVLEEMKKGNPNIALLEPYAGRTKRILMKCLLHNIECRKTPAEIINGGGCFYCGLNKVKDAQLISQEEFENRVRYKNPHIRIDGQYTGSTNPIDCYCLKHNVSFSRVAVSLYNDNSGCEECHKELVRKTTGLTKKQYVETLQCNFPYISLLGDYASLQEETDFYCSRCETSWTDRPILVRSRGCPYCERNRTENLVGQILDMYGIKHQRQYTFEDCIDKRKLPFDYYLLDYNVLCEYDGEQHYYPVGFGCSNEQESYDKFLYTKRHDQIKNQYCIEHNIPLIRIPYWERDNMYGYLINELTKIGVTITK